MKVEERKSKRKNGITNYKALQNITRYKHRVLWSGATGLPTVWLSAQFIFTRMNRADRQICIATINLSKGICLSRIATGIPGVANFWKAQLCAHCGENRMMGARARRDPQPMGLIRPEACRRGCACRKWMSGGNARTSG